METIKIPLEHIEEMIQELEIKKDNTKYRRDAIDCAQHYMRVLRKRIVDGSTYRIYFSPVHIAIIRKIFNYCVQNKTHVIHK